MEIKDLTLDYVRDIRLSLGDEYADELMVKYHAWLEEQRKEDKKKARRKYG